MMANTLPIAAARPALTFALVTLAVTFIASRGRHSRLHHRIAWMAMGLEVLTAAMALVCHETAIVAAIGVAGCFLAVYFTDSRKEVSRFDHTLRVLKTGWRALTGWWAAHRETRCTRCLEVAQAALEESP